MRKPEPIWLGFDLDLEELSVAVSCSQAVGLFFCWWYNNEADPAAESCGQPSLIQCSDPNTHTISS